MNETKFPGNDHQEETHSEGSCPFCCFMKTIRETKRKHGEFYAHLCNAQIEILQAFKSLADQRISSLEKLKSSAMKTKKATKIEVD